MSTFGWEKLLSCILSVLSFLHDLNCLTVLVNRALCYILKDDKVIYPISRYFNTIQTHCFHSLFYSDCNLFIGAPTGSGKTIISQIAFMRLFKKAHRQSLCVFIAPMKALVVEHLKEFRSRFRSLNLNIIELSGDNSATGADIQNANIIITTPEKWDAVTRNTVSLIPKTNLVVIDEVHLLAEERGAVLESIVARIKFNNATSCRIISNSIIRNSCLKRELQ